MAVVTAAKSVRFKFLFATNIDIAMFRYLVIWQVITLVENDRRFVQSCARDRLLISHGYCSLPVHLWAAIAQSL
jgi:hypothetical protein